MKRITHILLFGMVLALSPMLYAQHPAQPDENFHIYLCFGQSNMEGCGPIEAQDTVGIDPRFKMMAAVDMPALGRVRGQWYPATPPLTVPYGGLSPADYFGRTLLENLPAEVSVGIVNVAVGGCKIELFDEEQCAQYLEGQPDWLTGKARYYGNNPYAHLIALAREAQRYGVIKGILLHQGESNTGDRQWPYKVKTLYERMLADLHLDASEVPLLAGEVVHASEGGACASMNEIIATLPEVIPTAHVISSEGCPSAPDKLHFTSEGYRILGRRYAHTLLCHEYRRREGTYRNPILYADVPDMSVCFDGTYYYMVSTTMHLMPGAPIMRSPDMQHWETISYLYPRIDDGDRYDLVDGTAYGQGQWASSIRYHDGQFYVWFSANGHPWRGFVYTATDAAGPWTLHSRPPHHHDGSLVFDTDGRVYLFHGTGQLTEFAPDLSGPLPGGIDTRIFERDADERGLLEGSSAFIHNGKYYLMMISMDWGIPGRVRREVCYRADHITGPYEKKVILETPFEEYGGVGQGCIVQGHEGRWHALIFQDRDGVGRVPCLMPCTWIDGWPILGDEHGRIPNDLTLAHTTMEGICGSDDFASPQLSLYWQWNHNPIDGAWSLTARRGALRLTTARCVPNLFVAPNTLTQRMVGPTCSGTVCLDIRHMRDGDRAGLAAFNGDSGVLSIEKDGNAVNLVVSEQRSRFGDGHRIVGADTVELARISLKRGKVYLRIDGTFGRPRDLATFSYSLDGKRYHAVGEPVRMSFDYRRMFMGSKFAIFNYATRQTGGYVDVLSFSYE
jgi:beta-xylosidase